MVTKEWVKGGQKLLYDGYVYVKQKNLANNVVSYSSACKAKVKVFNGTVIGHLHIAIPIPNLC